MAEIGKLTARIGLNVAELKRGVSKAAELFRGMSKKITAAFKPVMALFKKLRLVVAAVSAVVTAGVASISSSFDRLAKSSRALGIPVDELSRLEHVASLSGLSVQELAAGIRLLAKNMGDIAAGAISPAAKALDAMNIQIKDANGNLKSSDQVMREVADAFKGMEDGAGKTALAMSVFGESGAKLIPLLNQGGAGIAAMKAEADDLGIVLDQKTAAATEHFNDQMNRLWKVGQALAQQIFKNVLPALTKVATAFLEQSKNSKQLVSAVEVLTFTFKSLLSGVVLVKAIFEVLASVISTVASSILQAAEGEFSQAFETLKTGVIDMKNTVVENTRIINDLWAATAENTYQATSDLTEKAAAPLMATFTATQEAQKAAALAQQLLNAQMAEGKAIFEATRTPMEALILRQQKLNELLKVGAIDADTFGRAMKMNAVFSAKNFDALAGQVGNALGVIFKDSKTAAIAQALINTYQGISQAIATYPPPISTAMAAVQAAVGFAQVAAIRRTTEKSSGGSSSTTSASAAAPAAAPPGPNAGQTLTVEGLSAAEFVRGPVIQEIAESLLDYQKDGGAVAFAE